MTEARLARLSQFVLGERNVRGARALGWRRYRDAACGFGGQWLRLAVDWSDVDKRDVKTDEGLGLSLRAVGDLAEAARIARPWADKDALMRKLYVDAVVEALSRDNPPEPLEEERLAEFAAIIEPVKSPLGAQALGWYRLERGEFAAAERWFKDALAWWPPQRSELSQRLSVPAVDYRPILAKLALTRADYRRTPLAFASTTSPVSKRSYVDTPEGFANTEEGYARTLRALGRLEDAEAIAWPWRDRWPGLRRLFLEIAVEAMSGKDAAKISAERLDRYAATIEDARSAPAATAMAWRELNAKAPEAAARWFERALAWSPPGTPDPGLIEGYVAALQAQKKFDEADKLAARWRGVSPRFDLIYLQSEVQALRAADGGAPTASAKYAGIAAEVEKAHSGEGALSLGWLAYETKDYARALTWFHNAVAWGAGDKGKEGVALSLRALDRFEDLAAFGYAERAAPAVRGVYYGGMIAWLTADKPVREVKAEARRSFEEVVGEDRSANGAQALGWASILRGQGADARRWFESAVGWSGFDPLADPQKPDAERIKLVEGYVQAVRAAGDLSRSEDVAYVWRGASPGIAGLYLQIVTQEIADDTAILTSQRMARFAGFARTSTRPKQRRRSPGASIAPRRRRTRSPGSSARSPGRRRARRRRRSPKAMCCRCAPPAGSPTPKTSPSACRKTRTCGRSTSPTVVAELADAKAEFGGARLSRFVAAVGATRSSGGRAGARLAPARTGQLRLCGAVVPQGAGVERRQRRGRRDRARPGAEPAQGRRLCRGRDDRLRLARSQPRDGQIVRRHRRRGADARGAGR